MKKIDVIIIGSGIGGLCCAGLLARFGKRVVILEAHTKPGGAAHSFERKGYKFESGPSLWSGLGNWPTTNPLGQILRLLKQEVELVKYQNWNVQVPEGHFTIGVGDRRFVDQLRIISGDKAVREWESFITAIQPIGAAANAIPLLALNPNKVGILQLLRRSKTLLPHLGSIRYLRGAFGGLVDKHLEDPFLRNWIDLLCFLISGLSKDDTNAAAMATLFADWFKPNACLEYPKGGSESIVNALLNGVNSFGGELRLQSKVDEIIIQDNKVTGIKLQSGEIICADYVVSNADIWNTIDLLPSNVAQRWKEARSKTPKCRSFLHMHLGFNAEGLDEIPIHSVWVHNWDKGIKAERNVVVLSIPSVLDPSMAPLNRHVLHGYTPANEPWDLWKDLIYKEEEYVRTKEERAEIFWKPLETLIPDIRERIEIQMIGTPLTHQKFLNATNGSYGPALSAAKGLFPGNKTPIQNLLLCGSSTFPGIGIPPVAASGALAANKILGPMGQVRLLQELGI